MLWYIIKHYNDYNIYLDNDFVLLYPAMDKGWRIKNNGTRNNDS
jgi:hypothetical protein